MKDCAYYQELISRLVDREITPEQGEELAAHARECEECRAVYDAFASLSSLIGDELVDPPEELSENVMAEIRRSVVWKQNRRPRQIRRWAALAASAVLVIGVGALTLPRLFRTSKASEASSSTAVYSAESAAEPVAESAADSSEEVSVAQTPSAPGPAAEKPALSPKGAASQDSAPAQGDDHEMAPSVPVSEDFAAPASDTTKSETEMIAEAIARSEEPETVAETVDVTGQGRGKAIAALLTGTQGQLPSGATPDRRFLLRFDVDGISSQVLISVYGEKVFFISLSGEESDMVLADCKWSELYARIYN